MNICPSFSNTLVLYSLCNVSYPAATFYLGEVFHFIQLGRQVYATKGCNPVFSLVYRPNCSEEKVVLTQIYHISLTTDRVLQRDVKKGRQKGREIRKGSLDSLCISTTYVSKHTCTKWERVTKSRPRLHTVALNKSKPCPIISLLSRLP